jgi:hypothetical protein
MSGYAYIGRKECGCVTCAIVDIPALRNETAKTVADWIRRGRTIERVTNDEVKNLLKTCTCDEKQIKMVLR